MNTVKFKCLVFLLGIFLFLPNSYGQSKSVLLSELDLSLSYQQYGVPLANLSAMGEPLKVGGKIFEKGIGVYANSSIKLNLKGKATQFASRIGINDHVLKYTATNIQSVPMTDGAMVFYKTGSNDQKQFVGTGKGDGSLSAGSVIFKVVADGKEIFNSGLLKGSTTKELNLDLAGVKILELLVDDAGDGNSGDFANWLEPIISYVDDVPTVVDAGYQEEAKPMSEKVKKNLQTKINKLVKTDLPLSQTTDDWLLDAEKFESSILQTHDGKSIVLTNGLVSRVFRIFPNLATIDLVNHTTNENLLRAVSNEGILKIDNKTYTLGGLDGQFEYAYTQYKWIDNLQIVPNSFRVTDYQVSDLEPRIQWANKRWSLIKSWQTTGKVLTFFLEGPAHLHGVKVKINYAIYDGIPTISKWMEVENKMGVAINLDEFTLEQLALAEPESLVEEQDPQKFRKPNIHVESDWGFLGFTQKEANKTTYWTKDPHHTSQCSYMMLTPNLLEIKLPMGPNETIREGETFNSFRTWIMPLDGESRERQGLAVQRMYKKIAPWTTENPILMHCTSTDPKVVRTAIDQAAETGYEMVVLSFGSGLNMENESEENIAKFKALNDYAKSKNIELGGYSLLSSRWISDEVDVINPKTGKRGGMIFGSSPCLSTDWGYDYFRKIRSFYEKTGMTIFENDGSYPGNVCASTTHAHHKGLQDSQWKQRKQIASLYQWMCEEGIYTNIPDWGYMLNGGNKVGIGYREVNWSLPRERQLVLGRQVLYDGLWERLPGMCWTFVPLTQYHGGGAAATLEPLSEHLDDYKSHMIQNYGSGVQACYRGHRLYDTEETKNVVVQVIDWYKKYRNILNSEIIHLRRADGRDWDGIMHIDPQGKQKALAMLYNPTDEAIQRTIRLPLYYTGIASIAKIQEQEGTQKEYKLARDYSVEVEVVIPARGNTWLVIE